MKIQIKLTLWFQTAVKDECGIRLQDLFIITMHRVHSYYTKEPLPSWSCNFSVCRNLAYLLFCNLALLEVSVWGLSEYKRCDELVSHCSFCLHSCSWDLVSKSHCIISSTKNLYCFPAPNCPSPFNYIKGKHFQE